MRRGLALCLVLALAACEEAGERDFAEAHRVIGGDAARGKRAIHANGCGNCHIIPGLGFARGTVGPSLKGFASRTYIGGVLPNRPGHLTNWLIDPPRYAPGTAMPDMGIDQRTAKDIAAWLYANTRKD